MSDCINTVTDFGNVREAVCVSTRKIMDACRDQDCMENIPVQLTAGSQEILAEAASVRARSAELLLAEVETEPVPYQSGYYCVNVRYFYRIICDATLCGVRPVTLYGLATAERSAMLFGGEGAARTFRSDGSPATVQPIAVVEAVDPVVLAAEIVRPKPDRPCPPRPMPEPLSACFDDELIFDPPERQLQVTLGQFSLIRLERDTQLLIPCYDYCMPAKACTEGDCGAAEDPCEAFSRMQFPVSAFFPVEGDTAICGRCGCQ